MLIQILFIGSLFYSASYGQVCDHRDRSSLLAFDSVVSTVFSPRLNWSSLINCCHWEGVRCDARGKVTHLELPSRGLKGLISSSVGNLSGLTHLNLSDNYLYGALEKGIGRLTNLKILDLSLNSLHGPIPQEIGNLLHLKGLHLGENQLKGPISPSLMNCSNLEDIIFRFNQLDGDISNLNFSRIAKLKRLDLANNKFTGNIPESIYFCKSLVAIRVAANNLSGQISPRISELKSLSFVSISHNFLTNITSTLQSLARCRNLTAALLSSNFYGEPLPVYKSFIGLDEFSNLQILTLNDCKFGGLIPSWLSKIKRLRLLSLRGNQMIGRIPNWMGNLSSLVLLDLSKNSVFGEFPLTICQLPSLIVQKPNFFHFELPVIIDTKSTPYSSQSSPYLGWTSGFLPPTIDLSHNRMHGNIPLEIGSLCNIIVLNLYSNNFSGHIPMTISNLKNLGTLMLDFNRLTGEIPPLLKMLSFLSRFNVSYNSLEGPIPIGGQFDTFDESSFDGNPRLCGRVLNRSCTKALSPNTAIDGGHKSHNMMHVFMNGLIVGSAFGFSSVLAIVASYNWFNRCKKA